MKLTMSKVAITIIKQLVSITTITTSQPQVRAVSTTAITISIQANQRKINPIEATETLKITKKPFSIN